MFLRFVLIMRTSTRAASGNGRKKLQSILTRSYAID